MKKIFLLIALIFQFLNLFSQDLGKSNGNIGVSQSKGADLNCNDVTYYSEWRDVSCYSKIKYRLKAVDLWDNGTVNVWKIQFKNNYSKNVNIKFKLYVGNELRIEDIIGVNAGKHWGIDCAGGSGAELSQSLSLDYKLEIEEVKEDIRGTPMEDVKGFECDGVSIATNYKKYYPKTSSTNNSNQPQTKAQQKADAINQLATATVDLVTYFANRKNALRNSLSQEDAQALLDIVNSENPTDYTQNIIQIFTDLGYTLRKTETDNSAFSPMTTITMNNDINNINDFLMIFIHPANYSNYNSISFSYNRRKKLFEQLSALGNNLKGGYTSPEIKGVPPSRIEKVEQERILKEEKKIEALNKIESLKPTETGKIVESNITPQNIIDKYILALGGTEKLKSVQDITIIEIDPNNYKEETRRAYGKYFFAMETNNGKVYYKTAFNGEKGYNGSGAKITDEEYINRLKETQPLNNIFYLKNKNFTLGKIEKFNEKDCYSLINQEQPTSDGSFYIVYYYFDVASGLLLGKKSFNNITPNEIRYQFYQDYKNIDGIMFPTSRIEFKDTDRENSTKIKITTKLNQGLKKSDFK